MTTGRAKPLDAPGLLRSLAEHGVDFVVIGGFSLAAHGVVRGTKNLDIVPDPDRGNLERLLRALEDLAAEPLELGDFRPEELPCPLDLGGLAAGRNLALSTRRGRLDVMQYVKPLRGYEELRAAATLIEIDGEGPYAFAGLDHLVAMKRAAGRPQDLIDIADLERARGLE